MSPKQVRALVIFGTATAGAAMLDQVASRQAAKVGLPHVGVGVIATLVDYAI